MYKSQETVFLIATPYFIMGNLRQCILVYVQGTPKLFMLVQQCF